MEKVRHSFEPNPRNKANILSSIFFFFMIPIFYKSFKYGFNENDLFETLEEDKSTALSNKLENAWIHYNKKNKKWSLHFALWHQFGSAFMLTGLLLFCKDLSMILLIPYLIKKLVKIFPINPEDENHQAAYIYASGLIVCLILERLIAHPVMFWNQHLGAKMRIACCSMIYKKILRFNRNTSSKLSSGLVINLITNDLGRFDHGVNFVHYVWIAPIQAILAIIVLYSNIGSASLLGFGFLLTLFPVQLIVARRLAKLRLKIAKKTDERVRLMNEIISGVLVIKMYTWEKSFAKLIEYVRRQEVKLIRSQKLLWALTNFEKYATKAATFLSLLCLHLMGGDITAEIVFSLVAIYDVVNHTISSLFEFAVRNVAEINVSINRVNTFLNNEESHLQIDNLIVSSLELTNSSFLQGNLKNALPQIDLENIYARWTDQHSEFALENITFNVSSPQIFAIVGQVGSGKSSLINIILHELPLVSGRIKTIGQISYSSQEPWIFSGSARQNILFGADYDTRRYTKVCKMCALDIDFQQFPYGDFTQVGENGKALSGGQKARINLARCIYRKADIYILDDPLSAVDATVAKKLFNDCIRNLLQDKICILITHQLQFLKSVDNILILNYGRVEGLGTYDELVEQGHNFKEFLGNINNDEIIEKRGISRQVSSSSEISEKSNAQITNEAPALEVEKLIIGEVNSSTYKKYFKAGGCNCVLLILLLSFILFEITSRGSNYFLAYWVDTERLIYDMDISNQTTIREILIYEYSAIIIATITLAIFHHIFFVLIMMRAAINLHNFIFQQLLQAKMQFFNTNPTGRILNRFSKDLGAIDEYLPTILYKLLSSVIILLGIIILTSFVNPLLLSPAIGLLLLFYGMRVIYIKTSRCAKRIEGITRSPIINHVTTTLNGLTTIRALSAGTFLTSEFNAFQDIHTSAYMLFLTSTRAFAFWLDLISGVFIGFVIIALVTLNTEMQGGEIGLIITQYMGLMGTIQYGMRLWSELENQMTSVERVLEYTQLENEPEKAYKSPLPKEWPLNGKIEFINICMKYTNQEIVLENITFHGNPAEKIGIVGRTGAGKSSIIMALFQLYDTTGSILVDNVDITQLPLHILRSKISIVPQEPFLFSGSMRKNLDPFDEYSDHILWHALEQVELKDLIADMPQGLNTTISEGGANYSVGQRQLVCLARAIIRSNKLLVLDEATANADSQTDELIQKAIRSNFAGCTVLTIAHRLNTIMDYDKILVVDFGRIVEYDTPLVLLQKPEGVFKSMVNNAGHSVAITHK